MGPYRGLGVESCSNQSDLGLLLGLLLLTESTSFRKLVRRVVHPKLQNTAGAYLDKELATVLASNRRTRSVLFSRQRA